MKITNLISLATVMSTAVAHAALLDVTTTADTGAGSLRAQIAAAASGDTVSISINGTITLTSGEILVSGRNLSIIGPGADKLTITTAATTRALRFVNSQSSIGRISFNNCKGLPGDVDTGGAISVDNFSSGGIALVTTITDCAFSNNQSGWGGAVDIFNGGLALNRCTFTGNTCTGLAFGTNGGGGAVSLGPTVASTITNCTFSANSQSGAATGQPGGGAIYNYGSGYSNPPAITVEHCTFYGNTDAASAAGAIKGNYTASYHTAAKLKNCLLANNQSPAGVLRNFSGNSSGSLSASYASLGGNVTDETSSSTQFMSMVADNFGNPALSPTVSPTLSLNGGSTKTHAINRGSPAQRHGVASTALTDQRGAARHAVADAGAFELIEPEISLTEATTPIPQSGKLDFGSAPFNTPVSKTITVTNTQSSVFTTGPLILANLSSPSGFSISGFPASPLANGESASFTVTLNSPDSGLLSAPFSFTGNDAFSPSLATDASGFPNQHTYQLAALVTDTFTHWSEQHFGPESGNPEIAGDQANPAGDGIVNLMKYALGLDPMVAGGSQAAMTAGPDSSGFLKMSVARNPAATDVSMAIEVTGDLSSPDSWNTAGVTVDLDTSTRLEGHDNTPISTDESRFIRLRVNRP